MSKNKAISTSERRIEIFNLIEKNKTVEVNDLATLFSVSTMTIRRDLAILEKQGIITTNYGGAFLNQGRAIEPGFALKYGQLPEIKERIGAQAAMLIQNGDSIFIDCGTTTMYIAKYLQTKKLTVMTNSLAVSNLLQAYSKIKLIMAPGVYDDKSAGFLGPMTIDFLHKYNVDKAFVGTQGFDVENGATVPDEIDAEVKKAICKNAKQRILLLTHEKIGTSYFAKFADTKEFDYLVTDDQIDIIYIDALKEKNINLVLAK